MSTYVDIELARALEISMRGLTQIETELAAIKGFDMEGERSSAQSVMTTGLILTSSDEPYAVVRMEDVWPTAEVLTSEEREVAEFISSALTNINHFTVKDGSLVRKS